MNVDMTLAPVVDVNTNPRNVVIGNRAFGSAPEAVGATASAFIRACQSRGVAACAKHWPGHGDTEDDTHAATAVTRHSLARLRAVEIPPFVDAVKAGVASVLVAHVRVPGMEAPSGAGGKKKSPPASRSAAVVRFLRERVGFGGVVMSDDMEMGALLNEEGGVGQCAVDGLRASVDLFLACHTEKTQLAVVDALRDAIETDATRHTRRAATDAFARLRVLADAFVDGADAADLNARALETNDRAGVDVRPRGRAGGREARAGRVRDVAEAVTMYNDDVMTMYDVFLPKTTRLVSVLRSTYRTLVIRPSFPSVRRFRLFVSFSASGNSRDSTRERNLARTRASSSLAVCGPHHTRPRSERDDGPWPAVRGVPRARAHRRERAREGRGTHGGTRRVRVVRDDRGIRLVSRVFPRVSRTFAASVSRDAR